MLHLTWFFWNSLGICGQKIIKFWWCLNEWIERIHKEVLRATKLWLKIGRNWISSPRQLQIIWDIPIQVFEGLKSIFHLRFGIGHQIGGRFRILSTILCWLVHEDRNSGNIFITWVLKCRLLQKRYGVCQTSDETNGDVRFLFVLSPLPTRPKMWCIFFCDKRSLRSRKRCTH